MYEEATSFSHSVDHHCHVQLQILQKAISFEPNNHLLWNSLGVVSVSEFAEVS